MISYAQNFEDVILWRVFKCVSNGFYIDLGAAWPDVHSVTKSFYMAGWRGINVEPNPDLYLKLLKDRPDDINLQLAVSESNGELELNLFPETGLSTLDGKIAEGHVASHFCRVPLRVSGCCLRDIWKSYVPKGQDVHFLKVDVEGAEEEALRSNDWLVNRPWVVLVESTFPLSQVETYQAWEPILLDASYTFAYADGLNRFYVENSHLDLLATFKYPPNVFDEFVLASEAGAVSAQRQAEARAATAEEGQLRIEARIATLEKNLCQAETRANQAEDSQRQAETRAIQAEGIQRQAEIRAIQAEDAQHQAEALAAMAVEKQREADALALKAQDDQRRAEERQHEAEVWAKNAGEGQRQAEARAFQLQQELASVMNSKSWRFTKPLRAAIDLMRRLRNFTQHFLKLIFIARLKVFIVGVLKVARVCIVKAPILRKISLCVLDRFPRIKSKVFIALSGRTVLLPAISEKSEQFELTRLMKLEKIVSCTLGEIKKAKNL